MGLIKIESRDLFVTTGYKSDLKVRDCSIWIGLELLSPFAGNGLHSRGREEARLVSRCHWKGGS